MQRWDLAAPNDTGAHRPRVLFSTAEARAVVVELAPGGELGDHQVRERAIVQVVSGTVECSSNGSTEVCESGTLVLFDPGERHAVRAQTAARLLLVLAPWPAPGHYAPSEDEDPHALPSHATQPARGRTP